MKSSTTPDPEPADSHQDPALSRRGAWHPISLYRSIALRPRLYWSILAAVGVAAGAPEAISINVRCALAWNVGGLVYLVIAFRTMSRVHANTIRRLAARQDEGRFAILLLILLAIAASFAAIFALQTTIKAAEHARVFLVALAGSTIVMSWMVTQVVFAMHYAHDYYHPDGDGVDAAGGLKFSGTESPDYWDFFYFATSIGATSQTSDVTITSRTLRRLVTIHCIVAFLFNTSVLALSINLAAAAVGN